ncbi:MAG: hypothetical protein K0S37_4768, partial [Microbacterium sp.]|nr:hypothetical protein [Microbacterium sp.]
MSKPPIDLYWWTPTRSVATLGSELRHHAPAWVRLAVQHRRTLSNYGDVLNRILVETVTGRPVRWREVDAAQLVAVGSVLVPYLLRGGTGQVWGSGLSKPEGFPNPEPEAGSRFLSVRGPMTR